MAAVLPTDLLRPIIAHVTHNKDLCSLSLACHALRDEAQRAMFTDVVVAIFTSQRQISGSFFDAIIASPNRLALMVRKLTINIQAVYTASPSDWRKDKLPVGQAFANWLDVMGIETSKGLQLMRQITHLRLEFDDSDPMANLVTPWLETLLEGCVFRLQVFVWDVPAADLQRCITKNLANQTDMRTLVLFCEFSDLGDPQLQIFLGELCKKLHTLSAPWEIIRSALECGISIPHLQIASIPVSPRPSTAVLRTALGHVTHLWCRVTFQDLDFDISDLSSVVLLQIDGLSQKDLAAIDALPKLEILILVNNTMDRTEASGQMVKHLLSHSANLIKIYVKEFPDWTKYHPSFACYTYDPMVDEVTMHAVFRREIDIWRYQSDLEFPDR